MRTTLLVCLLLLSSQAPCQGLDPVPFTRVSLSGFWGGRQAANRTATLARNIASCVETGRLENLIRAGRGDQGGFQGRYYDDSDLFKAVEGMACIMALHPDPELEATLAEWVSIIAKAQQPDGYLNSYFILTGEPRWANIRDRHELYCAGHLIEAAIAHNKALGSRELLDVALRLADHIEALFGPGKRVEAPGHQEIELALVKLADLTGEKRYLDLSRFFLEARGDSTRKTPHGAYWQDHMPLADQREAQGHAVRAMYFFAAATDVAMRTGETIWDSALDALWRNIYEARSYVTGGIGSSGANEGFTEDHDLPSAEAYAETCAAIASMLWNHRLFLRHREGRFLDALERALFNGFLSGVSLDGGEFFYVNPLASDGSHRRKPWYPCACCPPNILRQVARLGEYFYATGSNELWVCLYGSGKAEVELSGAVVRLVQETEYPWSGKVSLVLDPGEQRRFFLNLRIPGWCRAPKIDLNGERLDVPAHKGFLTIDRDWQPGDRVEIDFPMPVERMIAHPALTACAGQVALCRGPLVYCLEGLDNGGTLEGLCLPRTAPIEARPRPEMLGGITLLEAQGLLAPPLPWQHVLYQPVPASQPARLVAIPYFAWANRDASPMTVWIPETPSPGAPPKPSPATPSASWCFSRDRVDAINDGLYPGSGGSPPRHTWWDRKGSLEWVQLDFPEPIAIFRTSVYWFEDGPQGGCRVPASARLLWLDGEEWRAVPGAGALGTLPERWNRTSFRPLTTRSVRLEVRLQEGYSGGVWEWRL